MLLIVCQAEARDRNGQISAGLGAGPAFEAPWADSAFRSAVGFGPRASAFARYHHESNYSGFELALDYFRLADQRLSNRSLSILYFWRFSPEARIHPVVGLGVGFAQVKRFFQTGSMDSALFTLRAGVEYELNPEMDIAFHLDHLSIFKNEPTEPNAHVLAPTLKFVRYFGHPPAAVPAAAAAAGDKDTDGDGVPDAQDKCPGTASGVSVNPLGCAQKQSFEIRLDVKFRSGTSQLADAQDEQLGTLAKILADNRDLNVEIQGHTDNLGGKALNLKLSKARAEAVRARLIQEFKVDGSRLKAEGYGSSQPVDTNNNPSGRANNRRVTAKVIR
jgi:outer membrane protein OmpA-like peptidoglycan-associated protein